MLKTTRRRREESLLKGLEDGTYQEFLDGDLVTALAAALKAAHRRDDRACHRYVEPTESQLQEIGRKTGIDARSMIYFLAAYREIVE